MGGKKIMSLSQLETAFHPRSIAVVGASANPMSVSYSFVRHLLTYKYRGIIYPINTNQGTSSHNALMCNEHRTGLPDYARKGLRDV